MVVCAFMYVYPTSMLKSLESACMQSFIKIFYVFQSIMYFHPVRYVFSHSIHGLFGHFRHLFSFGGQSCHIDAKVSKIGIYSVKT